MGGFAGGDEAGFWNEESFADSIDKQMKGRSRQRRIEQSDIQITDSIYSIKAHAAITPFIKLTKVEETMPTLLARLVRLEALFDTIRFEPCDCDCFTIEGCDSIPLEKNSIYKAYQALIAYTNDSDIEEFFHEHKVVVEKRIPTSAGLGAAASDAAAFIRLLKETCNLVLSFEELVKIGTGIDARTAFYLNSCPSANIIYPEGLIEPFEEEALKVELYTSTQKFDTAFANKMFKEQDPTEIAVSAFANWEGTDTKTLLAHINDPLVLNDLYAAALEVSADLKNESKDGWFASVYGTTIFRVLN